MAEILEENAAELASRAKNGDSQAFALIYDTFIKKIYDFVFYKTIFLDKFDFLDFTKKKFLYKFDFLDFIKHFKKKVHHFLKECFNFFEPSLFIGHSWLVRLLLFLK